MMDYSKVIDLQDFDSPQLRPILRDFARLEMRRFGIDEPVIVPDSKHWECAMAIRSFEELGLLSKGAVFAGIGAGTEITTYYLASKGCVTFPCDRYMETTPWSDVAPIGMMLDPQRHSELDFPPGNVIPVSTDARKPRLPSSFFDGVYSSGSIEHFGSLAAVSAAALEIARILKPGGIASISTEFRLDGPEDKQWFDENCILFTPELINRYIIEASGLALVGQLRTNPSDETFKTRKVLVDFLESARAVRSLSDKQAAYPNLVLYHDGFLFCSVHLLLRKPEDWCPPVASGFLSHRFDNDISHNNEIAIRKLSDSQKLAPTAFFGTSLNTIDLAELINLREQLELIKGSASWRITAPLRKFNDKLRRYGFVGTPRKSSAPEVSIYKASDLRLNTVIGQRDSNGLIHTSEQAGILVFGPYTTLIPGKYHLVAKGSLSASTGPGGVLEVTKDGGSCVLVSKALTMAGGTRSDVLAQVVFTVDSEISGVEFRIQVEELTSGVFYHYELTKLR